jgi:anthranilate synthase component 2
MILVIDNYDSFVYNLARYLQELGAATEVVRNDAISVDDVLARQPRAIVLSPGPCSPQEAGISLELVRRCRGRVPLLGVCLGHQTIAAALGGRVVRAREPVHGRTSWIRHTGTPLFLGLANPFVATRYHSLVVEAESLPEGLAPTAWTEDGVLMALEDPLHHLYGVQFHPESILTQFGHRLLANFMHLAGLSARNAPVPEWTQVPVSPQPETAALTPAIWPTPPLVADLPADTLPPVGTLRG